MLYCIGEHILLIIIASNSSFEGYKEKINLEQFIKYHFLVKLAAANYSCFIKALDSFSLGWPVQQTHLVGWENTRNVWKSVFLVISD